MLVDIIKHSIREEVRRQGVLFEFGDGTDDLSRLMILSGMSIDLDALGSSLASLWEDRD